VARHSLAPSGWGDGGGGTKIAGRKRHIGVDTLGLLLAVWVTAASVSDNVGGIHLLSNIANAHPASPRRGPTPATAPRPSITAAPSASTSKSYAATQAEGLPGHPEAADR